MKRIFPSLFLPLLLFALLQGSCQFLDTGALTITDYAPKASVINPDTLDAATVSFSTLPDKTLAEEAFSLTADGLSEEGRYTWVGSRLEFRPHAGWKSGRDYEMKVGSSVEDLEGRSLSRDFVKQFSTRTEKVKPEVSASTPADGDAVDVLRPTISVTFTEQMDPGSVADNFKISPSVDGYLDWDAEGKVFTYILKEDLDWQTDYTVSVSTEAADLQNNLLADTWKITFFTGKESIKPSLTSLTDAGVNITGTPDDLEDEVLTITASWEADYALVLTFSEPMDTDSLSKNVMINPQMSWQEDWNSSGDALTLTPDSNWDWGEIYTVLVKTDLTDVSGNALDREYRYNLRVDGSKSRPPEVVAVAIYTDPSNAADAVIPTAYAGISLAKFNPPPQSVATGNTVVDVFFNLATGAAPNLTSLGESFLISGEGVKSFIPLAAAVADATFNPPNIGPDVFGPSDPGVSYDSWVRFVVFIDNADSFATGILTLKISGDMVDDGGRVMGEDWEMPIQITD